MTKRHVRGQKTQSLETAMREWELEDVLNNEDAHFMNESSGLGRCFTSCSVDTHRTARSC